MRTDFDKYCERVQRKCLKPHVDKPHTAIVAEFVLRQYLCDVGLVGLQDLVELIADPLQIDIKRKVRGVVQGDWESERRRDKEDV